jgi:hypothetical protein
LPPFRKRTLSVWRYLLVWLIAFELPETQLGHDDGLGLRDRDKLEVVYIVWRGGETWSAALLTAPI